MAKNILEFNTQISHGTFHLRATENELNCLLFANFLIYPGHLCSRHRMSAIRARLYRTALPDVRRPALSDHRLAGRKITARKY